MKNTSAKLDYIIIDSLCSLDFLSLQPYSVKEISLKYLYALKQVYLHSDEIINIQTDLFEHLPNINYFYYFNDSMKIEFEKFKKRIDVYRISFIKDLNFDFFIKHFSNQIEKSRIMYFNSENITKQLSKYHFPNLIRLEITSCDITRIEKKLFDGPQSMIQLLDINSNSDLEIIDHDAFSNMKQLVSLDLSFNNIESLDRRLFSGLINLESLKLNHNRLKSLDENIFSNLKNLKELCLRNNQLEILDAKLFVGLKNLNELNLYNNEISNFDVRILDNLPLIKRIHLSENKINNKEDIFNRFAENKAFNDLFRFYK